MELRLDSKKVDVLSSSDVYINVHCKYIAGITALEMAEGKPPYGDIHPMRAIFMIPTKPPPSLREPSKWSPEFLDFVNRCLVKNPEERPSATQMLDHDFISKYYQGVY